MRRLLRAIVRYWRDASGFVADKLVIEWQRDAEVLERRGAEREAELMRTMASELEAAVASYKMEALTLEQAVEESGYSRRGLERQMERGELANVGSAGAPRVRRGALPRKARREVDLNIILGGEAG